MFSNKDLKRLILPLLIEQVLAVLVGMLDIMMVSSVGEAAVSGVSLVDTIGILLINIFSALATGGAVISAQYLGREDHEKANISANQLVLSTTLISLVIMLVALIWREPILSLIFGHVEKDIMDSALTYFLITALSYPFLSIYNACAALYRSMGNSKLSMKISFLMNLINLVGNALCIYGLRMGVAGVAIPTLVSRAVAAIVMLILIRNPRNLIHIDPKLRLGFHPKMIKKILSIGVPNGLENSMFQVGKILVASLIATYGSVSIAANAVSNTVATFQIIPGTTIGLAMITVVGQCIGARNYEQAKEYTKKLLMLSHAGIVILNAVIILLLPPILKLYNLSAETAEMARQIIILHGVVAMVIWPESFTLPNALRSSNDVKFTMFTSILSMWFCRIILSFVLGSYFGLGVLGVWIAMMIDWLVRSIVFIIRYRSERWKKYCS